MSYYESLLVARGINLAADITATRLLIPAEPLRKPRRSSAFDKVTGYRICCVCDEPKPPDCFTRNRNTVDGRDARCKPCKSQLAKKYKTKRITK